MKAVAHYRDAVDTIRDRQGDDAGTMGDPLIFLGHALISVAEFDEACSVLEIGIAIAEKHVGRHYPGVRQAILDLGLVYCRLDRASDARSLLESEVEFLDAQPYCPNELAPALKALSIARQLDGDLAAARDCRERLRRLVEEQLGGLRGSADGVMSC